MKHLKILFFMSPGIILMLGSSIYQYGVAMGLAVVATSCVIAAIIILGVKKAVDISMEA